MLNTVLQRSPNTLAGFKGPTSKGKVKGYGRGPRMVNPALFMLVGTFFYLMRLERVLA